MGFEHIHRIHALFTGSYSITYGLIGHVLLSFFEIQEFLDADQKKVRYPCGSNLYIVSSISNYCK